MRTQLQHDLQAIASGTAARKRETATLEFKEARSNAKEAWNDLAEAAVCFANATGGQIVVGVADSPGGPDAFVGCDLDADTLRQRIYQLTSPSLLVQVEELAFTAKRLLVITVPEGLEVHSTVRGHSYHRVNDECVPMRPLEVTRVSEERRGIDWSATSSHRPLDDIDPLALRHCRRLLNTAVDEQRRALSRMSDLDLLRALRTVADDGSLTRSGEMLLCGEALSGPREVVVYQHRRTPAGEADAILRPQTPLVLALEATLQAVRVRQGVTPVTLAGGQQLQLEDYPTAAVREALVNALIHGDWRARTPVTVEHSPEYLKITSSGPLVSGVTIHNILTKGSRARFPSLAAAFRLLGLAEEVGQGVDRMFREMIRSGRDTPAISEDDDSVTILLRGQRPNIRIARFLAALPADEQEDTDTLLVVLVLCRKRTINATQLAPVIQRSEAEAQSVLRRIRDAPTSLLEPTRATANRTRPTYRLTAEALAQLGNAVAYHGRTSEDVDRKIIDHLNDYREINNRTVQRLFDVDVYAARDILQDLVTRDVITRVSEQTRGKAVRYGPGSAFLAARRTPRAGRRGTGAAENR